MEIIRVRSVNSMGKTKGCEKAPVEVLDALKEIHVNEKGKEIEFSKLSLEEIHVDLNNLEEANYLILKNSEQAFYKNEKVFFIGGDHSISYCIGKSFEKVHNGLIIVFDAHADCMQDNSKAGKEPTHEEWLRKLVDGGFNPRNIILIGTRSFHKTELDFLKKNEINFINMDILQEDLQEVCDLIMERARQSNGFYISIDIDVLDPGFAPGTSYQEPGGMSSRDLIYFIKRLSLLDNFKGADIVEINPDKDINKQTIKLGAKLLAEMI